MNNKKTNQAAENQETMDLLAGRIDAVTPCATTPHAKPPKERPRSADKIEVRVTITDCAEKKAHNK